MTKWLIGGGLVALALVWSVAASAASIGQHGGVSRGAPGYLGIDVRDVSDDEVPSLKLKGARGAEIIRVDHDAPAGKMGLREHDVVVQMNGAAVDGEEQIRRMLHRTAPGQTVALVVSRDGLQITLTAQMADQTEVDRQAWELHLAGSGPQAPATGLPGEDPGAGASPTAAGPVPTSRYSKSFLGTLLMSPSYTGVMLERLGPQLAQFFGVPKGTGLLVKSVADNSPAAVAGIHAGDVVLRADTKSVASTTDWTKAVREAKGRPVSVIVLRDRQEKTLTLTPDARKHSELGIPLPWERSAGTVKMALLTGL